MRGSATAPRGLSFRVLSPGNSVTLMRPSRHLFPSHAPTGVGDGYGNGGDPGRDVGSVDVGARARPERGERAGRGDHAGRAGVGGWDGVAAADAGPIEPAAQGEVAAVLRDWDG